GAYLGFLVLAGAIFLTWDEAMRTGLVSRSAARRVLIEILLVVVLAGVVVEFFFYAIVRRTPDLEGFALPAKMAAVYAAGSLCLCWLGWIAGLRLVKKPASVDDE
ncbi:MAG: hypothetical protein V2A74_01330, partial [bacterium]